MKLILELVNSKESVSIEELSNILKVSKVTVRRDLDELDKIGKLSKVHGGAVSFEHDFLKEYPTYTIRKDLFIKEKSRIAEAASKYVNPGSTIILDSSTTVMNMAKYVSGINKLKIITNDLMIANKLTENDDLDILVIGGERRRNFFTLMGYYAEMMLKEIRADKVFLGADAVDINEGLMNTSSVHVRLQRLMIDATKEIFILCDHSKFHAISLFKICSFDKVSKIITGKELDSAILEQYKEKNIDIDLV